MSLSCLMSLEVAISELTAAEMEVKFIALLVFFKLFFLLFFYYYFYYSIILSTQYAHPCCLLE